ncbi:uncharacterized protein isoform X7 [Rhodnius prolixus]|uniref:uncharacterized protein isoform X7 n=1 Tax=Rhodnius prolixus TaxID=13249 RepID=UPI003D18CC4D
MSQRSKMFKKSQMMTTEKPSASEIEIIESYGEDKGIDEYETLFLEQDVPEPGALIDSRLYKYVKWTETENSWRLLQIEAIEVVEKKKISDVIVSKFRDSFAGEMLYELNKQQPISAELQEKKLDIIKKNLMLNEFPNSYERLNYYVDDIVKLIDDCRKSNPDGIITLPLLVFKSPLLRFTHCQISLMNNCLLNCENLQALILASNYITDFPGSYLPRNLKMLELYANLLYKIDLLCTEPPQRMVYLGLGRNFLSLESETINLLLFQHLCHLDLSDNDFENMDELLETLPKLLKLQSLQLIGNPCSLAMNYVRKIQTALPTLSFLDGEPLNSTLVFEKDKNEAYLGGDACLQVHVFRIMGFRTDRRSKKEETESELRTVAKIAVPLEVIKWNVNHLGYMWDIKRFCVARPYPHIEKVKYKIGKDKTKLSKKSKIIKEEDEKEIVREIPPYLTCHFGVGLKREQKEIRLSKTSKKAKTKKINYKRSTHGNRMNKMETAMLGFLENLSKEGIPLRGEVDRLLVEPPALK